MIQNATVEYIWNRRTNRVYRFRARDFTPEYHAVYLSAMLNGEGCRFRVLVAVAMIATPYIDLLTSILPRA
jgi:hypothetical protein